MGLKELNNEISKAKDAIGRVFSCSGVSISKTREALDDLQETLDVYKDALKRAVHEE